MLRNLLLCGLATGALAGVVGTGFAASAGRYIRRCALGAAFFPPK